MAGWGAEYPAMLSALHTSFPLLLLEGANALHLAPVNSCGTSGWPVMAISIAQNIGAPEDEEAMSGSDASLQVVEDIQTEGEEPPLRPESH